MDTYNHKDHLVAYVCRLFIEKHSIFPMDTIAKNEFYSVLSEAMDEVKKNVGVTSSCLAMSISFIMARKIIHEQRIDLFDMPEKYEIAVVKIKMGEITTEEELVNFLNKKFLRKKFDKSCVALALPEGMAKSLSLWWSDKEIGAGKKMQIKGLTVMADSAEMDAENGISTITPKRIEFILSDSENKLEL